MPHQHRANAASAQRTTLLATEGKLSPCVIRRIRVGYVGRSDRFGPARWHLRLASRTSHQRKPQHYPDTINDHHRGSLSACYQQHAIVRVERRCVKQLFFKNMFRGKQDLRSLKRLFRAAD